MSISGGTGPTNDPHPVPGAGLVPPPYPGAPAEPVWSPPAPPSAPSAPDWQAPDPATRYPHDGGAPRRTRGNRALAALGISMVVFAVLGFLVIAAGVGLRNWEMGRLLDEIERSEAVMVTAQEAVERTVTSPQDLTGQEQAETLQDVAATANSELQSLAQEIAALRIAPWDTQIEQARTSYLAHNAAWQQMLAAASQDARQWFQQFPEIDRTWNVFVQDIQAAVPYPDLRSYQERVDTIVGEGTADGTGGAGTSGGLDI